MFRTRDGFKLELQKTEAMKLFSSKKSINKKKKKNWENVPSLEVFVVVSVQCNLVGNQHQPKSEE